MELRQRGVKETETGVGDETVPDSFSFRVPGTGSGFPSADEMIEMAGSGQQQCKHGFLLKRNNSMMMHLMPCCLKKWKQRYFVLLGGYLYRFSSYPDGTVKGVPIPVDSCTIRQLEDGDVTLDPGEEITACFEVSMIRKQYIFMASSSAECLQWVASLKARKMQAIKENLGHATVPPQIRALNDKASKKVSVRIRRDRDEGEARIKEMTRELGSMNPLMGSMGYGMGQQQEHS